MQTNLKEVLFNEKDSLSAICIFIFVRIREHGSRA